MTESSDPGLDPRYREKMRELYRDGSPLGLWMKAAYEITVMFAFWLVFFIPLGLFAGDVHISLSLSENNVIVLCATATAIFSATAWCWSASNEPDSEGA